MSKKSRLKKQKAVKVTADRLSSGIWLSLAAIAVIPVLINPWGFNKFALPKMTFIQVALMVYLIKSLYDLSKGRSVNLKIHNSFFAYLLFAGIALISAIFSIHHLTAFFGQTNRYDGLTSIISYGLFALMISSSIKNKTDYLAAQWSILVGLLFVSIYAVLQHFGLDKGLWYAPSDIGRVFSTIGNSNLLGTYIALVLPTVISFYIAPGLKKNSYAFLSWAALPLAIATLIFTASRGPWIGAVAGLILFFFLIKKRSTKDNPLLSRVPVFVIVSILALTLLIAVFARPSDTTLVNSYIDRAKSAFNPSGGSAQYRISIWKLTIKMIADKPFLGSGPDTFKEQFFRYRFPKFENDVPADKAHFDFLQVASTIGLVGFAALLWFIIYFFASVYKISKTQKDADLNILTSASIAGIAGYLIAIQFSFSLPTVTPVYWAMIGMMTFIFFHDKAGSRYAITYQIKKLPKSAAYIGTAAALIVLLFAVRNVVADRYIDQAMIYYASRDVEEALESVETAILINSGEDSYHNLKAKMLMSAAIANKSEQYIMKSIKAYERSKKVNPYDEEVYFGINAAYYNASSKFKLDVKKKALKNIKELLQIAPESTKARQFKKNWQNTPSSDNN